MQRLIQFAVSLAFVDAVFLPPPTRAPTTWGREEGGALPPHRADAIRRLPGDQVVPFVTRPCF